LADVLATQGDLVGAQRALRRAGSVGNPFIPVAAGHFDGSSQRFSEGIARNPRHANFYVGLMLVNEALGNDQEVVRAYELGRRLFPSWEAGDFQMLLFFRGRGEHEQIRAMLSDRTSAFHPMNFDVLPVLDDPQAARLKLREMFDDPSLRNPLRRIDIAAWAAYFGDIELALQSMEESVDSFRLQLGSFWGPLFDELRQTETFRNHLRKWGIVDYWDEFGWPPQCTEIGGDGFRCE
jgi:hypothetical protein